jgi:hypothetical protein
MNTTYAAACYALLCYTILYYTNDTDHAKLLEKVKSARGNELTGGEDVLVLVLALALAPSPVL